MMIDSLSYEKLTDLKWSSNDDLQRFAKDKPVIAPSNLPFIIHFYGKTGFISL